VSAAVTLVILVWLTTIFIWARLRFLPMTRRRGEPRERQARVVAIAATALVVLLGVVAVARQAAG